MQKKYVYAGETYVSAWAVKRAIEKAENKRFGPEPEGTLEEKVAFWAEFGVTYTEEADPEPTPEEIAEKKLAEAKKLRAAKVAAIQVTVDGMTFDGDEAAQSRMARAITAAETAGMESTVWVLADNTVATVTKAQLEQALAKSMLAMAEVWTEPYEESSNDKSSTLAKVGV